LNFDGINKSGATSFTKAIKFMVRYFLRKNINGYGEYFSIRRLGIGFGLGIVDRTCGRTEDPENVPVRAIPEDEAPP